MKNITPLNRKALCRNFGKLVAVVPVGKGNCRELWFQDEAGNVNCVEASSKPTAGEKPFWRLTLTH
jgi:hypothetical protein